MKKAHQNLRLIIPSKENELFSITKYKKKSSDILANSFFSTQYSLYNKIKYSFDSLINQRKFEKSLNETGYSNNKTKYNIPDNNSYQIPFPSFPNKKPIPKLYKNSIKLVKYPKIQKNNFILFDFDKTNYSQIKEKDRFFNTFFETKMNAATQTYSSNINKIHHKNIDINISPIKKSYKTKYNYKLNTFETIKSIKKELKKKLNTNNFKEILSNFARLIELRDEHNRDIKYLEVTNLLLDEIYNLIQAKKNEKEFILNGKKVKSISTSTSQKYFNKILDKLNMKEDENETENIRKKVRFKTFLPKSINFQIKYSFNPIIGNKIEDKEYLEFENNNTKEIASNTPLKNKLKNGVAENIQENKNNNIFEVEDESDSPDQTLKSKYNLLNLMNEKKGGQRRNVNFDINNYGKNINNNNIYHNKTDYNNINFNNFSNYKNSNTNFGKTSNFVFNNFIKQNQYGGKDNKINKSNQEKVNYLNFFNDLTNKIDKKKDIKVFRENQILNKDKKFEAIKQNNSNIKNKNKLSSEKKEKIQYEKYFKNEKLINLIKTFSKLENIYESFDDDNSQEDNGIDEEIKNNKITEQEDLNSIDNYISNNNIELGKIKRKKRKAKTNIIKKIDFGIEIIKNICEEINLNKKDRENLFNNFIDLKKISIKPEITKEEETIQIKALRTINDFIKNYLIDMQKLNLTKQKPKIFLSKYFHNNLNSKLNDILYHSSENNTIESPEKPIRKKPRQKTKKNQKKKLIYDNSYFLKTKKEKEIPLKNIDISEMEGPTQELKKEKIKQKSPSKSSKKIQEIMSKRRKEIFKLEKRPEGLLHITPIKGHVLTEEEKKIEQENLLDRRLKAFFEEIKVLKNINNNSEKLNNFIDKEMEKIDYARDKKIEGRKYNFYNELKIQRGLSNNNERKFYAKRFLLFQSPVIFNTHKEEIK